ncbi:MAG: YbaN family protein [Novosphingobium sp.]
MIRPLYLAGGLISVALGLIGAFLPIVPTVPFLLLAAFCFARSNPEWEQRLLDHPQYGASLRDWRTRKAISRRAKVTAIGAMSVGAAVTWLTLGWPWVGLSLAILAICGGWIWTRNE